VGRASDGEQPAEDLFELMEKRRDPTAWIESDVRWTSGRAKQEEGVKEVGFHIGRYIYRPIDTTARLFA